MTCKEFVAAEKREGKCAAAAASPVSRSSSKQSSPQLEAEEVSIKAPSLPLRLFAGTNTVSPPMQ